MGDENDLTPPVASDEALEFLASIEDEDFHYLLFSDSLVTTSNTGRELGEFTITVQTMTHKEQECIMVHANSHGTIDNVPCGTSITSYITKRLVTIEQQHHEYVKLENCPLDRKTVLIKEDNVYIVNKTVTQGESVDHSVKAFPEHAFKGFISEGSNLLLHRLFSTKGLPKDVQFISFDSEANLCPAIYKGLGEKTQTVGNLDLQVTGIERTINSVTDLPTTWQSYYTSEGFLTSRAQVGSPVTMKLLVMPDPIIREELLAKPVFEKQPLKWEDDMQLYSKFVDRKEELKADHATYMSQHPELKAILADFLQFLLLRKPEDTVSFAAEYFSAFSPTMPSDTPYLSSSNPSPFPLSRESSKRRDMRLF